MKQKRLFWSPGIDFKVEENQLRVGKLRFSFGGEFFPEYYYLTCKGIDKETLLHYFNKNKKVIALTRELVSAGVLIAGIPRLDTMFYGLHNYTDEIVDEALMLDIDKQEEFQKETSVRNANIVEAIECIDLEKTEMPNYAKNHITTRLFDEERQIDFKTFSSFLAILGENTMKPYGRFYPSAGALYPIDLFLYIKKHRVRYFKSGIYYFYPIGNRLYYLDENGISEDLHYVMNREIFNSSAFSIFMVYNGKANLPKYGYKGYAYGLLDCGVMTELLYVHGNQLGIGCCSIGDMNFSEVEKILQLPEDSVVVHAVEVGLKRSSSEKT